MKCLIVCVECGLGPLHRRPLYRDNGSLFHNGKGSKGRGGLFCAAHAPKKIKQAILVNAKVDPEIKRLAV